MLTLRQSRVIFFCLFLLPVFLLALAMLGVGAMRTSAEWSGTPTAADTLSGPATLAFGLLLLTVCMLIIWAKFRRRQGLSPPAQADIAPRAECFGLRRHQINFARLEKHASMLDLECDQTAGEDGFGLILRDRWRFGYLVTLMLLVLAVCVIPPTVSSGSLAFAPLNPVLVALCVWISLFLVLLALPTATRRVDFLPERDALLLADGRRQRVFGLSRLQSLEVRLESESSHDSDIQQPRSTRWHAQLIGWFEVDGCELTAFVLITGPRSRNREQAERYHSTMTALADTIAHVLSVSVGRPDTVDVDVIAHE